MAKWMSLGKLNDIGQPGSSGFAGFFVVRDSESNVRAYRNACPHTGAPLEWVADQFLDMDKHYIQCSIHGALFRMLDGYCIHGPCVGQSLQALPVEQRGSEWWVDVSEN